MKLTAAIATFLIAGAGFAQDWAKARLDNSPRHQEWVDVRSGDRTLKMFVVYPEREDKAHVVVLIHEIMGLTEWVMSVADQLAEHGYIAVAPDFLSGMAPGGGRSVDFEDLNKIREAISGLPPAQVTSDLNAASDYAKGIASATGRVFVGGFCWGGTQTFNFARERRDIAGAFVFYGTGPTEGLDRIQTPVYGFYGGNDNRVNATIPESERLMKEAGKRFELVIYEGAGHGFMRAGEQPNPEAANKKARDEAWARWLNILKEGEELPSSGAVAA